MLTVLINRYIESPLDEQLNAIYNELFMRLNAY